MLLLLLPACSCAVHIRPNLLPLQIMGWPDNFVEGDAVLQGLHSLLRALTTADRACQRHAAGGRGSSSGGCAGRRAAQATWDGATAAGAGSAAVDPTELRRALAAEHDREGFGLGEFGARRARPRRTCGPERNAADLLPAAGAMGDAGELLLLLFERINRAHAKRGGPAGSSLADAVFGLSIRWVPCPALPPPALRCLRPPARAGRRVRMSVRPRQLPIALPTAAQ